VQVVANERAIGTLGVGKQVHQRQSAFALVEIAENLLAVNAFIPNKVE
jgi:hypothetical protein